MPTSVPSSAPPPSSSAPLSASNRYRKRTIDLSVAFRLANLPSGAKLDLVENATGGSVSFNSPSSPCLLGSPAYVRTSRGRACRRGGAGQRRAAAGRRPPHCGPRADDVDAVGTVGALRRQGRPRPCAGLCTHRRRGASASLHRRQPRGSAAATRVMAPHSAVLTRVRPTGCRLRARRSGPPP